MSQVFKGKPIPSEYYYGPDSNALKAPIKFIKPKFRVVQSNLDQTYREQAGLALQVAVDTGFIATEPEILEKSKSDI